MALSAPIVGLPLLAPKNNYLFGVPDSDWFIFLHRARYCVLLTLFFPMAGLIRTQQAVLRTLILSTKSNNIAFSLCARSILCNTSLCGMRNFTSSDMPPHNRVKVPNFGSKGTVLEWHKVTC
jgi:hypothetical protein